MKIKIDGDKESFDMHLPEAIYASEVEQKTARRAIVKHRPVVEEEDIRRNNDQRSERPASDDSFILEEESMDNGY